MICPSCQKDAPTVMRGMRPYCAACGAPRGLASATQAVNLAGQPARVGGQVARVAGMLALAGGGMLALLLGLFFQAMWHTGLFVATPIVVLTLLVSIPLFLGGRKLRAAGDERSRAAHEGALIALATRKHGVLTVPEAAAALSLTEAQADEMLTALVKKPEAHVSLELDDAGGLSYVFHDLATAARSRFEDPPQVRFATGGPPVRVSEAHPAPAVIDAELIDEEVDAPKRRTTATR